MTRTKKAKQPQPKRAPIHDRTMTTHYGCRCGNTAVTSIRLTAVTCVKCGAAMKAVNPVKGDFY